MPSFKSLLAAQALAMAASASVLPRAPSDPVCSQVQTFAPSFPRQSSQATSYCSSRISTVTSTSFATVSAGTTTVGPVVTYTPTTTSTIGTATCFTPNSLPTKFPGSPAKRQAAPASSADGPISTACSCYGVNIHPTSVVTQTSTTFAATVTNPSSTSTVTAHGPFAATATAYVHPSSFYVSPAGASFNEYRNFDFYGNDLYNGNCGANGAVDTPYGNIPCNGFESCENACAVYNDANVAHGHPHQGCIGVSFVKNSSHCYLKYAMEDCNPEPNGNVDSGLLTSGA